MKIKALITALVLASPALVLAYPNGTPLYVTDMAPVCASCHSATQAGYMPELSAEEVARETPEGKHYALVNAPVMSPYVELTDTQKEKVIAEARLIDENSTVAISAPARAKKAEEIKVVVRARGGNGPVIGVMLVDRALRYQARPVQGAGWAVAGAPLVKGQGGTPQDTWLERRMPGLGRNLNFILVFDQKYDPEKMLFPEAEITYTLKAPQMAGAYGLAAAFLYGTENADTAGFFQRPSGRILFSEEITVQVE